ncbi:hypothetical protein C1X63_06135 [Pseudomonas sp. FW305-131]|nr:hypothetical protein C1X63_06135 [Pseudomonas sp. FW305-131]
MHPRRQRDDPGASAKPASGVAGVASSPARQPLASNPPQIPLCELARDGGVSVSIIAECETAIASKLAPTVALRPTRKPGSPPSPEKIRCPPSIALVQYFQPKPPHSLVSFFKFL